ncbi:hypothetical protein BVY00_00425 [bacterium G20]|nr:hypothetical protein BVY00_00425 [bacterium G20]
MGLLETFFLLSLMVQMLHSIEELSQGFNKKWYLFKMSFRAFLTFEILFTLFWVSVLVFTDFPARDYLQSFFLVLMFANGIQHLVWSGIAKKYMPGLITAFAHIAVFLVFYFELVL